MVQKHARVLPEIDLMLAVNNQFNNGIFIIYFSKVVKVKSFSYEYFQTHAKEIAK